MENDLISKIKSKSPKFILFVKIASDIFGHESGNILAFLILKGESSLKEISVETCISKKRLSKKIIELLRFRCLYISERKGTTFYTFNETGLNIILYSGEMICHIDELYGTNGAKLVQNVIINGSLRVGEYFESIESENCEQIERLFLDLIRERWLVRLSQEQLISAEEQWKNIYEKVKQKTLKQSGLSEQKLIAEIKNESKRIFFEQLEAQENNKTLIDFEFGMEKVKREVDVAINIERFEKHFRTIHLVGLSLVKMGLLSSLIYKCALETIEKKSPVIRHPYLTIKGIMGDLEEEKLFLQSIENEMIQNKQITFATRDIYRILGDLIDLQGSIMYNNPLDLKMKKKTVANIDFNDIITEDLEPRHKKPRLEFDVEDEDVSNDSVNYAQIDIINQHLKLLNTGTLIKFVEELSSGVYYIPFFELMEQLKKNACENLIKNTLGTNAHKILRCLSSLKMADEKTISNTILLKEPIVRTEIYKLIKLNAIEIQEIPKSADRLASKTFFLYRHKKHSLYNFLLKSLMFNLTEILNKIEEFKYENKILISKSERKDVKGHEEEYLLESELKTLKNIKFKIYKFYVLFNRIKSFLNIFLM